LQVMRISAAVKLHPQRLRNLWLKQRHVLRRNRNARPRRPLHA